MIYIVTWCLIKLVYINVPVFDEFDRYQHSYYDSETVIECGHEKIFYNRDSAIMFYDKAYKESIHSVQIDSTRYRGEIDTITLVNDTIVWWNNGLDVHRHPKINDN